MHTVQLGFDMPYIDPTTQNLVPWAMADPLLLQQIEQAPWKFVDTETTGLNPASARQNFGPKDIRRGVNAALRLRIVSVLFPEPTLVTSNKFRVVAFDCDQLTPPETMAVASAAYSKVVIAHNAGFDAYWLREHTANTPDLLLDSMLLSRVLRPDHLLTLARMCNDENEEPELRKIAEDVFIQGKSGWALAHLAAGQLRIKVEKGLQGPKNWCEPFLTEANLGYAVGDVIIAHKLIRHIFEIDESDDLLARYYQLRSENRVVRMIEPQVLDIVTMRKTGMPWDQDTAKAFIKTQVEKVAVVAAKLIAVEPSLAQFSHILCSLDAGVTALLKDAIGKAFAARGIELEMTEKANTYKIGEKDLRRVKAQISDSARELFELWVGLNKAKKAAGMAKEVSAYASRSKDGRLHPNTGHGPVTGRLSSSEPNCQQFPRDQGFRDGVRAKPNHKIVASDYSALDMRVGAALAIRAQQQILDAYMGDRLVLPDVSKCISAVYEGKITLELAQIEDTRAALALKKWKDRLQDVQGDQKSYWNKYRDLSRVALLAGFQRCLAQVNFRAKLAGTAFWGSLRDAFSIPGMDIHSWTALGMIGKDPAAMFAGLSNEDVAIALKQAKKDLGDKRQTGKVGNLSLLYAMKTKGLVDAAAKNYNIHWTFEEGDKVRHDWLTTYVEIDLWHKWTELTSVGSVYVPDPDKGNRYAKKQVFTSYTLGNRLIYAFGLNAALSYEDQSTGADILGRVMEVLREQHLAIFNEAVNQVHDELVFEIHDDDVEEHTRIIEKVMTDCAEFFLMPFGVKGECSPAIGQVWVKD
ncbi:MAG: DNA polymerase [Agitococcus sp.]|nr:DNA polymerase [Agitococcus sp.]MDO9177041.1 DNA polymerase [Agitococcus sp.]